MKKSLYYSMLLSGLLARPAYAQLLVDCNGNIGAGTETGPINSAFSIKDQGYSEYCANITADSIHYNTGLRVSNYGTPNTPNITNDMTVGIRSYVRPDLSSTKKAYGIISHAYKTSGIDTDDGRSYGLYGIAGNATSGWNYGVFGSLYGNNNGSGIFGSSEVWDGGINTNDKYAGFFHGKVKVTNSVEATAFYLSSDYRLKENIETIPSESIDDLMKLNVVQFNFKQRIIDSGDTTSYPIHYYTEDSNLLQKTHYGLIAQEIQDVYPNLVYEGGDGYLSVNYIEIIPILIQSIQSMQKEIDLLKDNNRTIKKVSKTVSDQNIPQSSSIKKISVSDNTILINCSIAGYVKNAYMTICDSSGNQVYSSIIKERGSINTEIVNITPRNDIFICSLYVDDEIDTRRFFYGK